MELRIEAKPIALALITTVTLLALAHVCGSYVRYVLGHDHAFGLIDTFNLNFENNVPTFFSAFLLLASAGLLALVARASSAGEGARYWQGLAFIFAFLAVDEDASLHELLIDPLRAAFPMTGPLRFAWVVPYGLAVLVLVVLYVRFVLSLPPRTRRLLIVAAATYLAGALGFELLGGWYLSYHGDTEDFPYSLLVCAEESLEMSGVVLLIYTLLEVLGERLGDQPLRVFLARRAQGSPSKSR